MTTPKNGKNLLLTSPQTYRVQKTLREPAEFTGIGLHTGKPAHVKLSPQPPNTGIVFLRTDLKDATPIPARAAFVVGTSLATTLGIKEETGNQVRTVEHLLAALYGIGVTNVLAEIEGPEVPILDGSAEPFLKEILQVGMELQPFSASSLRVLKPIKVYENDSICELLPRESLRLTTSIDFPHPSIGLQTFALELTPNGFASEVSRARTFGFAYDLEKLRKMSLAQGASLDNVLAFSEDSILNPEGMRFSDECVRHKLLDALGDVALCGSWIQGELVSYRGGHSIHLALLRQLEQEKNHWELVPAEPLRYVASKRQPISFEN